MTMANTAGYSSAVDSQPHGGRWPLPAAGQPALVNDSARSRIPTGLDGFLAGVERRALRLAEIATGSRDDALDIVQDAMLQLARRYGQRPAEEWAPLFYRILDNRIHDWQRHQSLRRRLFGFGFAGNPDAGSEEPDTDALAQIADPREQELPQQIKQQQAMRVLEGALRALPRRQREAFALRIWEGLSVEDTATAMGCSDGSVKTHLSRALQSLRAQLEGVWP
jgi:RNA polymerase sigma-70 factor (ECF subfamily)